MLEVLVDLAYARKIILVPTVFGTELFAFGQGWRQFKILQIMQHFGIYAPIVKGWGS